MKERSPDILFKIHFQANKLEVAPWNYSALLHISSPIRTARNTTKADGTTSEFLRPLIIVKLVA